MNATVCRERRDICLRDALSRQSHTLRKLNLRNVGKDAVSNEKNKIPVVKHNSFSYSPYKASRAILQGLRRTSAQREPSDALPKSGRLSSRRAPRLEKNYFYGILYRILKRFGLRRLLRSPAAPSDAFGSSYYLANSDVRLAHCRAFKRRMSSRLIASTQRASLSVCMRSKERKCYVYRR